MAWLEPSPTDRERRDLGGGAEAPSAFETPGGSVTTLTTVSRGGTPRTCGSWGDFHPDSHMPAPLHKHMHTHAHGIHFHILWYRPKFNIHIHGFIQYLRLGLRAPRWIWASPGHHHAACCHECLPLTRQGLQPHFQQRPNNNK